MPSKFARGPEIVGVAGSADCRAPSPVNGSSPLVGCDPSLSRSSADGEPASRTRSRSGRETSNPLASVNAGVLTFGLAAVRDGAAATDAVIAAATTTSVASAATRRPRDLFAFPIPPVSCLPDTASRGYAPVAAFQQGPDLATSLADTGGRRGPTRGLSCCTRARASSRSRPVRTLAYALQRSQLLSSFAIAAR